MNVADGSLESKRIGIVGVGAIGGWVAARLALAGHDVNVLARARTLAALASDGLVLEDGGRTFETSVNAAADAAELGPQDILVIAVKSPGLAAVAPQVRPMIGKRTVIVPMLNGVPWWFLDGTSLASVDPDSAIASALPVRQVVGCVIHASSRRAAAPNHVVLGFADRLILGEPGGGPSERVEALAALFEAAGITIERSADIRSAIWYKLWGNATLNPLSALTRATADRLLADHELRRLLLDTMGELAAVGAAIGCPISASGEDRLGVTARLGAFKTSMLQDVEAGRRIELEALLGAPREIAARVGVATPHLDRLYAMTRQLAENLKLL